MHTYLHPSVLPHFDELLRSYTQYIGICWVRVGHLVGLEVPHAKQQQRASLPLAQLLLEGGWAVQRLDQDTNVCIGNGEQLLHVRNRGQMLPCCRSEMRVIQDKKEALGLGFCRSLVPMPGAWENATSEINEHHHHVKSDFGGE